MGKTLYKLSYNGRNPSTHYCVAESRLQAIIDTAAVDKEFAEKHFNEIKITDICEISEIVGYGKNL